MSGRCASQLWYSQMQDFDFTNKSFDHTTGHFSQLVWRHSLAMGAAIATSKNGWSICVARYAPPGNVEGMFHIGVGDLCSSNQGMVEMERWRQQVFNNLLFDVLNYERFLFSNTKTLGRYDF